ncbi:unnamed protein product [Sphagnum tenellum]
MAQKVNPIAVRLNRNRLTDSSWFSDYYYAQLFHQDLHIRNYLYSIKQPVGNKLGFRPARCVIHHYPKRSVIHLFCLGASEVSSFASVASNRSKGSNEVRQAVRSTAPSTERSEVRCAASSPHFVRTLDRSKASNNYPYEHLSRSDQDPVNSKEGVQQQLLLDWQNWVPRGTPKANQKYSELLNTANEIGLNYLYKGDLQDRLCLISGLREPCIASQCSLLFGLPAVDRSVEPSSAWQPNLPKAERLIQPKRVEGYDGHGLIDGQELTEKSRMAENKFLTNSGLNYFVMQYWFQYRLPLGGIDVNWLTTFKHKDLVPSSKVIMNSFARLAIARPSTKLSRNYYLSHIQSLLSSHTNTSVSILPIKVTSVYQSAALVAQEIACKLEHTKSFRQICKTILKQIDKCQYIKGIRISCSGRLNGAEIAKTECKKYGETSLHVFSDQIDYAYTRASTPYGILGVKVWICYL